MSMIIHRTKNENLIPGDLLDTPKGLAKIVGIKIKKILDLELINITVEYRIDGTQQMISKNAGELTDVYIEGVLDDGVSIVEVFKEDLLVGDYVTSDRYLRKIVKLNIDEQVLVWLEGESWPIEAICDTIKVWR